MKNNYKKIFISLGLFLISLFAFTDISQAADIAASASRTSGVAPLSVHFNADLTASSETERSFHDLEYSWNFGDTNAGNWGTDNKPKNQDKGPISAHVYETPGIFTTTLTVRNATGIIDTKTFEITVTDPEVIFAGTKTTCFSTGSDFTGCPGGASHVTTSSLNGLGDYTDAGERALLRRGDSWTVSSNIDFPINSGPVHVGAFGSCSFPDSLGICSNAPTLNFDSGPTHFMPSYLETKDWRVSDLSLTNPTKTAIVVNGGGGKNNLFLQMSTAGFAAGYVWGTWRDNDSDYADGQAIISSRFTEAYDVGIYAGGERLSLMGTIVPSTDDQHTVRIWQGYQSVISHNVFTGSGMVTHYGGDALKFHGPAEADSGTNGSKIGTYAETGHIGLRNHTQFAVVANNVFGRSGPYTVAMGPQNSVYDERLSDIIFEKNKIISDYGTVNSYPPVQGLHIVGRYFSVRNNIIDGTGSIDGGFRGIFIERMADEAISEWPPLGHRIYNNTIYGNSDNDYEVRGISISSGDGILNVVVRNNYVSFPVTTNGKTLIDDADGVAVESNNVLTDTPYFIDPNNSLPLLRKFSLTSNSTEAINQGTAVPVFDDFTGQSRTGAYDIGAYEYFSGEDTVAPSAPANLNVL